MALAKKLVHYMGGQASGQAQRRMAAAFKVAPTLTVEVRLLGQLRGRGSRSKRLSGACLLDAVHTHPNCA